MVFGLFWSERNSWNYDYIFLVNLYVICNNTFFIRLWKSVSIFYMDGVYIISVLTS